MSAKTLHSMALVESNPEQRVKFLCEAAELRPSPEFRNDCALAKAELLADDRKFLQMALDEMAAGDTAKANWYAGYVSRLDPDLRRQAEELLSKTYAESATTAQHTIAPPRPDAAKFLPPVAAHPKPVDPLASLDRELARLKSGHLAYNTPEQMKMAETAHIVARIGAEDVPMPLLQEGMRENLGTKTMIQTTSVTPKMKMTLRSGDFDITALSSEEQIVVGELPTTWAWDIVPKHPGKLRLHLATVIELEGQPKDFTTIDREIAVKVTPTDLVGTFLKGNWQWIIATMTALIGGAWKLYSARKNRAAVVSATGA